MRKTPLFRPFLLGFIRIYPDPKSWHHGNLRVHRKPPPVPTPQISGQLLTGQFFSLHNPGNKAGIGRGGALRFPWFTKKKTDFSSTWICWIPPPCNAKSGVTVPFGHGFLDRLAWNSGNPQKSWEFGSDEVEHFSIFFFCLFSWWYFYGFQQWGYVSLREGTNILSFLLHFGAILMDSTMVSSSIFPASHPGSWFRRKVHLQLNSPT